jgi:hypothetical protein
VRDGALVAVHFQADARLDYAEAAALGALSARVRAIHAFNHDMLAPLWEHPAFEPLRQPGAVAESLHAGVHESYGGRFILPRLGAYVFGLYYTLGYVVHVGVATSQVTSKFYSAAAETLPGARRGLLHGCASRPKASPVVVLIDVNSLFLACLGAYMLARVRDSSSNTRA